MKHVAVAALAAVLLAASWARAQDSTRTPDLFECEAKGNAAGQTVSTTGNALGGFVGGLVLGVLGTVVAVVAAGEPDVPLHLLPPDDGACRYVYVDAYQDRGQARKREAALFGGILGTIVLVTALVVSGSS